MKKLVTTFDEVQEILDTLPGDKAYAIDVYELDKYAGFVVNYQEQKMVVATDGSEYPDEFWMTKENNMLQVQDIPLAHLQNILRMILRKEREMAMAMAEDEDEDSNMFLPVSHTLH